MISLLYSKSGFGKTYHIHSYAKQNNFQIIEINSTNINDFVLEPHSQTLDGKKTLFLFEGADNMSGYSQKISSFLLKCSRQNINVFLTANNLEKVSDSIIKNSQITQFKPYNKEKIISILKSKFGNRDYLEEIAEKSGGNLHQAFHMIESHGEYENREEYDNLEVINIILYEKNRDKVYKTILEHNIGGLYNWLYETAAINRSYELLILCSEMNKKLYKVNDNYIKGIIAYDLKPFQKLMVRLPKSKKPSEEEQKIADKIQKYYKCSKKESFMYLKLIMNLKDKKNFASKFQLDEKEQEFIGIQKEEVKLQIVKNIMQY